MLSTRRLELREFDPEDFDAVHSFVSAPVVCRYTDWGPNEPADTRAFLAGAGAQARAQPRCAYTLAAVRRQDDQLIGSCSVWQDSEQHRRGGLGFVFDPACWGQGYATEAAAALVELGFDALRLQRLEATCRPGNVASRRVLERVGFQCEGLLRAHVLIRGVRQDSLLFSLLPGSPP